MVEAPISMVAVLSHLLSSSVRAVIKEEETGKIFCDLVNDGDMSVIAKGGRGGRGNARFKQVLTVHRHLQKRVNLVKSSGVTTRTKSID